MPTLPRHYTRNGWRSWQLATGAGLILVAFAATAPAWADWAKMVGGDPRHGYVLLVPVVAALTAWSRRERLHRCRLRGRWLGPLTVTIGGAVYLWGHPGGPPVAMHAGALLVALGSVLSVVGWDVLVKFAPAWAVLLALVPVPVPVLEAINAPLQAFAAELAWTVQRAVGIPAERYGPVLVVAGTSVPVREVGRGVEMILALGLGAYALAFGRPLRLGARVGVMALVPLLALVCSTFGLIGAVWVVRRTGGAVSTILMELMIWALLLLALLVMAGTLRLLVWASVPVRYYTLAYDQ